MLGSEQTNISDTAAGSVHRCQTSRNPPVQRGALLPGTTSKSQRFCLQCGRPRRVCICSSLPSVPISTAGRVVILQHPSERKRNLATVPVLLRVLQDLQVVVGRFVRPEQPPWPEILADQQPLYVLFPTEDAVAVGHVTAHGDTTMLDDIGKPGDSSRSVTGSNHAWTLLAFDGSWIYGKEMMRASRDKLAQRAGPTTFVKIPELARPHAAGARDPEHAAGLDTDGPCLLRKEPNEVALCTYEAIARSLACLDKWGSEQLARMMAPLRQMTHLQAQFNPSIGDREAAFAASAYSRCSISQ